MRPAAIWTLLRVNIGKDMQFRAAFWSRNALHLFWSYITVLIIAVFYRLGSAHSAVSMSQAVAMKWIGQGMYLLVGGMGVDEYLYSRVRSGDVALDLCRPMDLYASMYAHLFVDKLARALPRAVAALSVGALLRGDMHLSGPASPAALLCALAALSTGYLLSCALEMIIYGLNMDVESGSNKADLFGVVMLTLSGTMVPLALFPPAFAKFMLLQPFAGMIDLPARLYAGVLPPAQLPLVLGIQLLWLAAALLAGRCLVGAGRRRIIVQGG